MLKTMSLPPEHMLWAYLSCDIPGCYSQEILGTLSHALDSLWDKGWTVQEQTATRSYHTCPEHSKDPQARYTIFALASVHAVTHEDYQTQKAKLEWEAHQLKVQSRLTGPSVSRAALGGIIAAQQAAARVDRPVPCKPANLGQGMVRGHCWGGQIRRHPGYRRSHVPENLPEAEIFFAQTAAAVPTRDPLSVG